MKSVPVVFLYAIIIIGFGFKTYICKSIYKAWKIVVKILANIKLRLKKGRKRRPRQEYKIYKLHVLRENFAYVLPQS